MSEYDDVCNNIADEFSSIGFKMQTEIDTLVAEVERLKQEVLDYQEKERLCSHCDNHPDSLQKRGAEAERLKHENEQLLEALDIAYTLASRHYQDGYMEIIKKLLEETKG